MCLGREAPQWELGFFRGSRFVKQHFSAFPHIASAISFSELYFQEKMNLGFQDDGIVTGGVPLKRQVSKVQM